MAATGRSGAAGATSFKLNLRKFDMSSVGDDKVVVFIGKRRTGKSYLVRDLMYHNRDIPIGTVVSATESANEFFSQMVPSVFVHDEVTPALLDNVINRQQMIKKRMAKQKATFGSSSIDPRAFLILDDCMYDSRWVKEKWIRYLFMNGRHVNALFMLTMQFPLGITPNLRTNIDYVFILREPNVSNRKRLYEHYAGMFPTFDVFCQVMDQCTENYECLVINNTAQSNKLCDQVFWYKAEQRPEPFKMCAPQFWALAREIEKQQAMAASDDDDDDDEGAAYTDLGAGGQATRKGPLVAVRKSAGVF